GVSFKQRKIDSMKALMTEGYDAIFVGSGAPRGRDLDIPGRKEAAKNIHIGIDWLSSVSFGHTTKIGKRVIVLGGGNTAMDCCRTSRRIVGGDSAFGPKNIIWAVAHGHDAAISIDALANGQDIAKRPAPGVTVLSQKMGIHEWSYDNEIHGDTRYKVPWADVKATLKNVKM